MRAKIHETGADRVLEENARKEIEVSLREDTGLTTQMISVKKMQRFSEYDWMITKGRETLGWGEFKRLNKDLQFMKNTGELWILLSKLVEGFELERLTGKPWIFFAQLNDALVFHVLNHGQLFYQTRYFEERENGAAYNKAVGAVPMEYVFDFYKDRDVLASFLKHADKVEVTA